LIKRIPGSEELYDFFNVLFFSTYAEDGMRLAKNAGFLNDKQFRRAYNAGLEQEPGLKTKWRAHVTQWAGFYASKLDGDFVECGVNKAFFSTSLMNFIDFKSLTEKKMYLFDTYRGIVEEQVAKGEKAAFKTEYLDTYEFVVDSFKDRANVIIVKGIVPDSLNTVQIDKVAYLSIDMNCAAPERAALEHFWDKIVTGGIIVLDDYAFPDRNLQQKTADEFADSAGVKILTVPTGQGIIIKQ